jgi:beta-glucosidase
MKLRKIVATLLCTAIVASTMSFSAFADWEKSGEKTYYTENGKKITGLKEIDGEYYYFSKKDGSMVTGRYQFEKGGDLYHFEEDGKMSRNETVKIGSNYYTFDADGKQIGGKFNPSETLKLTVKTGKYAGLTAEQITAKLTLEEKAAQMSMAPTYGFPAENMVETNYGGVLNFGGELKVFAESTKGYADNSVKSDSAIPAVLGFDAVHGVGYLQEAVIFPHNIGIGAANDTELTYQMGLAVADELKLAGANWNYAPCVAQATDPRWGRTYESYGTDLVNLRNLSLAYMKGNIDGGILVCPKHFFADGNVIMGTGEGDYLIDRGDAKLTEAQAGELLKIYKELVDNGAMSIMLSHSSVNGVKMHENKKYIDILKKTYGFTGFVAGDWNSIDNISGKTQKEKVINSVNAGIDMLMQMDNFDDCRKYIIEGVNEGLITKARVDDAVTRIIRAKIAMGLFDGTQAKPAQTTVGSDKYRAIARQLVEKSQVLVKNEGDLLPLKKGTKVFVTGPAADSDNAQNGGWTVNWEGAEKVPGTTTVLEALKDIAPSAGITLVDKASLADVVLLVVGEKAYAEWNGDTADMSITGKLGLEGNKAAIAEAKKSGKPTITLILAGRNVIISDYVEDWDAVVMGYLPGTEGDGVVNVLTGKVPFTGTLPMPWYSSVSQIGTGKYWLPEGYSAVKE